MLALTPTDNGSLGIHRCRVGLLCKNKSTNKIMLLPPPNNPWGLDIDIPLVDYHCSARLAWAFRIGVSLQTPYCFTALLFLTAGTWSEWSVAGNSAREVLRGYVYRGCRYSHRAGPGNHIN